MGIYDRDYGREESTPWSRSQNPRDITIILLIINVVVFLANMIFSTRSEGARVYWLNDLLAVDDKTLTRPWMWWQFLTYGFAHYSQGVRHLLFNMIGLYVFGRDVERRLGRFEFLRFYLVAIFIGGVVASTGRVLTGVPGSTIGASGAVVATVVLFACYFPNREILLMFVFPIKAWVLAVFYVTTDLIGAAGFWESLGVTGTAFEVHLAGAFFALGYYLLNWNLRWLNFLGVGGIADIPAKMRQRSRRMKLKLHDPEKKLEQEAEEADRILAKIHDQGESSLTSAERKILERYSRRQRERRNQ
ncbi:MAG: rhomboid family intramembrane serine protease [Planctomycetota bacterium]